MPKYLKNFITLAGLIIVGSFLTFLYSCITGLADFAGRFNPVLEPWVFWALFISVAACLAWGGAVAFLRPRPLLVHASPSEEALRRFRLRLVKRLRRNKYLREAGVKVDGEEDLETALAVLESRADQEIQAEAKRVFIGSAVAQNGRLDTLVVLFLVTRMVWRISKIYNQRPHWREMVNLYANIAATSFIAGSIEDFGVDEYVTELMTPLLGGSALGAVPGAQALAGTITESVLTGSANCLLSLRCGIIARNYMSLKLDAGGSMRRSATIEASKIFVSMSAGTVTYVTRLLVKGATGAVKSGSGKMARGVGSAVSGAAEAVGNGARSVKDGVGAVAGGVTGGVKRVVHTAGQAVRKVSDTAKNVTGKTVGTVSDTGKKVSTIASSAVQKTGDTVKKRKMRVKKLFSRLKRSN